MPSLALHTIALFLFIVIPGIAFRRFFYQGEFTKQFNSKTLAHSISASIFPGLIVQYATITVFQRINKTFETKSLNKFYKELYINNIPEKIFDTDFLGYILLYGIIMFGFAFFMALFSWYLIRLTRADRWFKILRFSNHWNYYLKGELKGFNEYKNLIQGELLEVRCDVLINVNNDLPRLYSGTLKQYTIDSYTSRLENLYLSNVHLWKKDKETNKHISKSIAGDLMILIAKDVININMHYVTAPKKIKTYNDLFGFLSVSFFIYMFFSEYRYFNSDTVFKTFLIKLFFCFYFVFILIIIQDFILNFKHIANQDLFVNTKKYFKKNEVRDFVGLVVFSGILALLYFLIRFVLL